MRISRMIALFAVVAIVLAGCGSDEQSLDPPDINYGVDMAEMGMPVVDPRFTVAALHNDSDEWLLFDDIGEFLRYHQIKSDDFQVIWVPDFETEEWIKAEDAYFVQSDEFCFSPMKWCVAAFSSEEKAQAAVEEYTGEMWSWETVFDETWDQAPLPESL